jgi:hypothetical protein
MHGLSLTYESGMRAYPPRPSEQPTFCPPLDFGYAEQLARDWYKGSRSFVGYVTLFDVEDDYVSRFERHVVDGHEHEELWVPAE